MSRKQLEQLLEDSMALKGLNKGIHLIPEKRQDMVTDSSFIIPLVLKALAAYPASPFRTNNTNLKSGPYTFVLPWTQ